MSNQSHIRLPRSFLSDPLWKSLPYTYRQVFITILENVVFKETTQDDFGVLIKLKPGQMLTTYRRMVELCNEGDIDRRTIERALIKFETIGFSGHETGHRKTIISITRTDILELIGTSFGTNSGQTRDIKEEFGGGGNLKPTTNKALLVKKFDSDFFELLEFCVEKEIPIDEEFINKLLDEKISIMAITRMLKEYFNKMKSNDLCGMNNPKGWMRKKAREYNDAS